MFTRMFGWVWSAVLLPWWRKWTRAFQVDTQLQKNQQKRPLFEVLVKRHRLNKSQGTWLWQVQSNHQGCSIWSGWSGFSRTIISQGKNKIPFYKKQVINKSTRVIFGLVQLVISDRASEKRPSWHKNTISQNDKYFEFFIWYLLSLSFQILLIKCFNDTKNYTLIALVDYYNKFEKCGQLLCAHLVHFRWPSHILWYSR